jgi:hypothetical protein
MSLRLYFYFSILLTILVSTGCGVTTDMMRDNNIRFGFINNIDFISPVRLKVGIVPLLDDVGLGTPEAGSNLSRLLSEEFAKNTNLYVVKSSDIESFIHSKGWTLPLLPEEAVELGKELDLNVVIDGAISQVGQYTVRKGWRRLVRYFTDQQQYVEAMLLLTAYDTTNGVILAARASEAEYRMGADEKDPFFTKTNQESLTQEAIEQSLDMAISEAYYRIIEGLAATPFKARILSNDGKSVVINYGSEINIKKGQTFVVLSQDEIVSINTEISYALPGPPKAYLKVTEVNEGKTVLEIVKGEVSAGEYLQSWEN